MKRKFTQILMLLTIAVSMGAIVTSCKDTNEDLYREIINLIGDDVTPGKTLQKQIQNLQNELDQLKATVALINSCECDMDALNATIQGMKTQIANLEANKADKSQIAALQTALDNLTTQYNTISGLLSSYKAAQDLLEGRVADIEEALKNLNPGSCDCDLTEILSRLSKVEQELITTKATAEQALALATEAKTIGEAAKTAADAAKAAADAAQATADAAQATADQAKTDAAAAQATADAAKSLAETLQALVGEHGDKLVDHEARIAALENQVTTMSPKLEEAYTNAANALAKAQANEARLDNLEPRMTQAEKDITQLKQDVQAAREYAEQLQANCKAHCAAEIAAAKAELMNKLNELEDGIKQALEENEVQDGRLDAIETQLNNLVTKDEFNSKVSELDTKIGNLKEALEKAEKELQDQIDAIKNDVKDLSDRVDAVENAIDEITDKLKNIAEQLKKMVTSIIIQGTYNPAFGSISLPANVQSNVLVAFFGTTDKPVKFPVLDGATANYIRPDQVLTEAEANVLAGVEQFTAGAGETLVSNEENNAGTLYLTINPAERDFEGITLSLENSQAKASGIKLGAAKKSDKTLGFGWTRAAANGFYEVPAYVTADGINEVQKVDFQAGKVKETVKEIYNSISNRETPSFTEAAKNIYDVLSGLNMDANAVKCEWTANGETSSVISTYNLAATAIKPWNFGTLYGSNREYMPGYELASRLIDKIGDKTKNLVSTIFDKLPAVEVPNMTVTHINFAGLSASTIAKFNTTVVIDLTGKTVNVPINISDPSKAYVTIPGVGTFPVKVNTTVDGTLATTTIPVDVDLTDVANAINSDLSAIDFDGLNTTMDDLKDFLDDVDDLFDAINNMENSINSNVDDEIIARAQSYLERVNGRLVGLFNSINSRLQPAMLGGQETAGDTKLLSTAKSVPTEWNRTTLDLIPTTWSFELAAPVCKKHVAVVDVTDNGGNTVAGKAQAVNDANEELNKVIDGNDRFIRVKGLEKGYTYTIVYSALDFYGNIATQRYYVKVK